MNCSRTLKAVWVVVGVLFLAAAPNLVYAAEITLTRAGNPNATIVVAAEPTRAAQLAALELQYHIERITGAVLPIVRDGETEKDREKRVEGFRVLVGESEATQTLGLRSEDFEPQEYLIRFLPKTLVLIGRDWLDTEENRTEVGRGTSYATLQDARHVVDYTAATRGKTAVDGNSKEIALPGHFDDQGTCYAVYDFLERFCGVRWYGPTELNIVFPTRSTLTLRGTEIRRAPAMKHREGIGGGWPIVKAQWNEPSQDELKLYWRRLRVGGEKWAGNHSFRSYYDRFLRENPDRPGLFEGERPDYFAKGWADGERQFCYTNPALVQQVVRDARDYFDGKGLRGFQTAMGEYFAVVPMDNANWCKCDSCQALLAKDEENRRDEHFSSGTASHYLFQFVNAVAREVRKTHPDKFISTLAYHVYAFRPEAFELEPNIAVAPCLQVRNYWGPKIKANDIDFYKAWVEKKGRPIYLWNYYCFPTEPAVIQGWNCFPGFSARLLAEQIQMYHRDGVRGVFLCGIGEQVDYYMTMKMYDDPSIDPETLLGEFFTLYFGAASVPMESFYSKIEETFTTSENYPEEVRTFDTQFHQNEKIAWRYLGTQARMDELDTLMQQAKGEAETDLEKRRVQLWDNGVLNYMKAGRKRYTSRR